MTCNSKFNQNPYIQSSGIQVCVAGWIGMVKLLGADTVLRTVLSSSKSFNIVQ